MSGAGVPIPAAITAAQLLARLTGSATLAAGALLYGDGDATPATLAPPSVSGSTRYALSHPGGAVPPAWSAEVGWKDQANTWAQPQQFPAGSGAAPSVAVGTSSDGWGRYASGVLSGSISGVERLRIQADRLLINANAAAWYSAGISNLGLNGLSFYGADGTAIGMGGSTIGNDSRFLGRRANGSASTPTALASGDDILNIQASGYDGSAFSGDRARLTAETAEAWAPGVHGTRWRLFICANGASALTEGLQVDQNGQLLSSTGSITVPGQSFIADPDTGWSRHASNSMAMILGGTPRLTFSATLNTQDNYGNFTTLAIRRANGSYAAPTKVLSGEEFGRVQFRGAYDDGGGVGVFNVVGPYISAFAAEDFASSGNLGAYLAFRVVGSGSGNTNERMRLWQDGGFEIGSSISGSSPGTGRIKTATAFHVGSDQVVGAAKSGWGIPTGTAERTTFATYDAPTISASPTQAEVQAIADHLQIISRRHKALIDDIHVTAGHGLLKT